ncbi:MAG TPA: glycine--tRNA ligase subunit beta, partial [Candidatus Cloacimonadota bacterium]|nr:glycine--tRNA ligase subunit beta [Candidatus Cloacimonadota bacterium]
PIRWIIALLDQEIIPFEYAGIKASNISQGNRFYQLESNTLISNPDQYLTQLRKVFVIADREERKGLISEQMTSLYKDSRFKIQEDQRLLDQVTDLVEYPTAVIASFEAKYLRLPEKIITSTLTQNQKYFAVLDENNQLTNYFVFISNGNPEHSDIIRTGNEKVVRARLEDAEFYYDEDLKKRLEYYVQKLDSVVFQAKLGTLLEKTERIKAISNYLCDQLNVDELSRKQIVRAAHLCKADLVTLMLGEKEFTKLQGYIGMNYALHSQEEEVVAQAIYEHYMPRGQNDQLPANSISAIVAIADKIDTVCGIIGVDLIPTGSNDPFALRRAANGIVQIAEKYQMDFNINELIDFAYTQLKEKLQSETHNLDVVKDFIKQRVRWLMEQNGFEYDLIDSLNHVEWNSLLDIKTRLSDLKAVKQKDDFIKLVLGFKRVSNIIEKSKTNSLFNETLLQEDAEKALYENFVILQKSLTEKLQSKAYHLALNEILPFNSHIDHFFDCVLVNCEDIQIKENRYALLRMIRMLFLQIADISKI